MVSDQVRSELEDVVEGTRRDIDWAIKEYKEKREKAEERVMEEMSDEELDSRAVSMVSAEEIGSRRMSSGEEIEIDILAIGQTGEIDEWGEDDDTVVYSYGFIWGPFGEDGEERAARAVLVNRKSDGLNLSEVKRKFHALNTMTAVYEVSESDELDDVFRCFSCESTNLNERDLDTLPSDRPDKLEVLRSAIPEASLATLSEDRSSYDPETGFTYDFGADLRRIEGNIVDYYIPDDRSWGRYTIMDDSVTPDDIVGTDIVDDDSNTPGLTVWAEPDYHMEHGKQTRAEFYGVVEKGSNGNLNMSLAGIVPIIPMPMDEETESADAKAEKQEQSL